MWSNGGMQVEAEGLPDNHSPDELTGLPDRGFFMTALTRMVAESKDPKRGVVLLIGLDHFRMLNISLGYKAADRVLQAIAGRMLAKVRQLEKSAVVARVGSDEFGILFPERLKDAVPLLAEQLLGLIREPILIDRQDIRVTASLGVSLMCGQEQTAELLWRDVGMAFDLAKKDGGNVVRISSGDRGGQLQRRTLLQNRLSRAIDKQELLLHYQPQVDLTTLRTSGLECLLRWNTPGLGAISPLEFIPIAEETGLIGSIGDWVLREACRQSSDWQASGELRLPVTVNVSPRQFQDTRLPERIQAILGETGLSVEYLELELTESMTLPNQAMASLHELKRIGIKIAIDDFGTGYSSLSYLQKLPIDILKIDQSFIRELHTSSINASIVETIVSLARLLKLRIVAEGVESMEVVRLLRQFNCHSAQGYYFSPPMEAARIPDLVRLLDRQAG